METMNSWVIAAITMTIGLMGNPRSLSAYDRLVAPIGLPQASPMSLLLAAYPHDRSRQRFDQLMRFAAVHQLSQRPFPETIQVMAEQLLGSNYREGLLDRSETEQLVTSLEEFDCVLFVEAVLALTRTIAAPDPQFSTFSQFLQEQRYRHKHVSYCDRLHYFSDWIQTNEQRGLVRNITQELGGQVQPKTLDFMTRHRRSYRQMADAATYRCIAATEETLQQFPLAYIPVDRISRIESQLQPGDIVAIATDLPGLDVTHTGLVYRDRQGQVGLIHASPVGAVVISPDLQRYADRVQHCLGIIVARPIDRRI